MHAVLAVSGSHTCREHYVGAPPKEPEQSHFPGILQDGKVHIELLVHERILFKLGDSTKENQGCENTCTDKQSGSEIA